MKIKLNPIVVSNSKQAGYIFINISFNNRWTKNFEIIKSHFNTVGGG